MKTPHWVLLFLTLGVVAIALVDDRRAAGLPDTPDTVHVSYWEKWTGFEGQAMKDTVAAFNAHGFKNARGQTIVVDLLTQSNIDQKTIAAIAAGNPPDVAGLWSANLSSYADKGALMPLNALCTQVGHGREDYIPIYWEICQYEGQTWALPSTPATVALYYNKGLFKVEADRLRAAGLDPDRAPQTLTELDAYAQVLTRRDPQTGRYTQVGFMPTEPGWWTWSWGYWFGGRLIDERGNITATDPGIVAAYRWFHQIDEQYTAEDLDTFRSSAVTFDSPRNPFIEGKVAMEIQGVWMVNFIEKYNPTMEYDAVPFPAAFDTQGEPVVYAEADILAIPKGAVHPEEAFRFIQWVNSPEGMEILCTGQGKHSPLAVQTPGFLERHPNKLVKLFTGLARSKNAFSTPRTPIWSEYSHQLNDAFSNVWHDKSVRDAQGLPYTPESALAEVQRDMQKRLDDLRRRHHRRKEQPALPADAQPLPTTEAAP